MKIQAINKKHKKKSAQKYIYARIFYCIAIYNHFMFFAAKPYLHSHLNTCPPTFRTNS